MNLIGDWFGAGRWPELTWTLIHSLWQGVIVALAAAVLLRRLDGRRPNARYAVALAALAATVLLPLATWSVMTARREMAAATSARVSPPAPAGQAVAPDDQGAPVPPPAIIPSEPVAPAPAASSAAPATPWTAYIAALWLAGLVLMLCRAAWLQAAGRWFTRLPAAPDDHPLARLARDMAGAMGLRCPIRVAIVERPICPTVAGWFRPIVVFSTLQLTGLTPEQLRAAMAHELAHLRRYDMPVMLAQRVIEACLFFNPAVWWLSRQADIEREACCDALAARIAHGRLTVAETLARAAASLLPPAAPAPALADERGGPLLGRVRRLLEPDRRIPVRLPWPAFGGLLLLCAALLVGAGAGAEAVGRIAAEVLSPAQQIEQARRVQKQYGPAPLELNEKRETITITGRVRTADGDAPPEGLRVHSNTHYQTGTCTYFVGDRTVLSADGTFRVKATRGRHSISAVAPGYAPAWVEGLAAGEDGTIAGVELTLSRGFDADVQLTDEEGRPIAGALVKTTLLRAGWHLNAQTLTSDADGVVTLKHLPGGPVHVETRTPGFEYDQTDLDLAPGAPRTWILTRAKVLRGFVVDKATGHSLPGANILLARRQGFFDKRVDMRGFGRQSAKLATTNDAGEFAIDTLRADCSYDFWIEVPGRGLQLARGLSTRQAYPRIEFDPIIIEGRFAGDPNTLETRRGRPVITVGNPIRWGLCTGYGSFDAPVDIVDGVARFRLANIIPGSLTLTAGEGEIHMAVGESLGDVVIPATAQTSPATREVTVRLTPPAGWPAPAGVIRTDFINPTSPTSGYSYRQTQIVDGKATVEVPLPADGSGVMLCGAENLPGYWFATRRNVKVPPGDEPMALNIPVQPAGTVCGTILRADGKPAGSAGVSLIVIAEGDAFDRGMNFHSPSTDDRGRFSLGGVPLGGTYRVCACDHQSGSDARVVSEAFTLDRSAPTREAMLRFGEGVAFEAVLLRPDGEPASGVKVSLHARTPWSHGFDGTSRRTDRQGRARWRGVNGDPAFTYSLDIRPALETAGMTAPVALKTSPMTVHLRAGLPAAGVVINADDGRPLPGVRLSLWPKFQSKSYRHRHAIKTSTDNDGRFRLDNLEDGAYQVSSLDVVPAGAQVLRVDGRTTIRLPAGMEPLTVQAGKLDHRLEVKERPKPAATLKH